MIDNVYKNSFKEVYQILKNTDEELINKIPLKFINFLRDNMNTNYETHINTNIGIDKQNLLPETEDILSLIYRSYWATNEEKVEFANKDKQEFIKNDELKKIKYKDVDEIFKKKQKLSNITLDNNLMVLKKENFIKTLFNKLIHIFKK